MSRQPARDFWQPLVLVALTAAVRSFAVGQPALRGDEGFSVRLVSLPLQTMFAALAVSEPNPPIQYLLVRGWMALAGRSEVAVRWPSVLAGVVAVALAYRLARTLTTASAARLAMLWLALSPFLTWFSQDVRVYSVMVMTVLAASLATWQAARRGRWRDWAAAGALWWVALGLHYFAVVTLAAVGLAVLGTPTVRTASSLRRAGSVGLIAALTYLPWVAYIWPFFSQHTKSWLEPVTFGEVITRSLTAYSVGGLTAGATDVLGWLGAAGLGGLAGLGVYVAWRRDRLRAAWLLALGPATPLLLWLMSLYRPVYVEHYAIAGLPGTVLLAALGLTALRRPPFLKALRLGLAAGGCLISLLALQNYFFNPAYAKSPDWRGLTRYLQSTARPGEVVLLNQPDPAFDYYYHGPMPFEAAPPGPLAEVGPAAASAQLQRVQQQYQHLRFLFAPSPAYDPDGWVEAQLAACCEKTDDRFVDKFRVQTFDTPAGSLAARQPLAVQFEDGLNLTGYRLVTDTVASGATLPVTLFWSARQPVATSYTVFVHVLAADGFQVAGGDSLPRAGAAPTTSWRPGQTFIDPHTIPLTDVAAGDYTLEIGLYQLETGQRLLAHDAAGNTSDHIRLPATVRVTAP